MDAMVPGVPGTLNLRHPLACTASSTSSGSKMIIGRDAPPTWARLANGRGMFVDMVTGPMSEWELVAEYSKLVTEPPDGLLACVVLPEGDGQMRCITVWETPGQRGDFAANVMMPLFDSGVLASVQNNPEPVQPVALFARGKDAEQPAFRAVGPTTPPQSWVRKGHLNVDDHRGDAEGHARGSSRQLGAGVEPPPDVAVMRNARKGTSRSPFERA